MSLLPSHLRCARISGADYRLHGGRAMHAPMRDHLPATWSDEECSAFRDAWLDGWRAQHTGIAMAAAEIAAAMGVCLPATAEAAA